MQSSAFAQRVKAELKIVGQFYDQDFGPKFGHISSQTFWTKMLDQLMDEHID